MAVPILQVRKVTLKDLQVICPGLPYQSVRESLLSSAFSDSSIYILSTTIYPAASLATIVFH